MPFAREPLIDLRRGTLADIQARLPGSDPFVRRSALNVLGTVLAGHLNLQYGYLDWESRMAVPFTTEGEYLLGWAAFKGKFLKPASYATGTATVTGGIAGAAIPAGTELARADGALYTVPIGATIAGDGTASFAVSAQAAGLEGNADPGTPLAFTTPVPGGGVPVTATVVTLEGGAEVESDASLRTRMLQAFAAPPQGGDLDDYIGWALEVPGVTRAWTGGPTIMGAGSVTVYFMIDDVAHPSGLPIGTNGVSQYDPRAASAAGDQLLVADHIFSKRPVTALVYGAAPVGDPLNLTLSEVPVDTAIRAGITDALASFLIREATPGGVVLADLSNGGTLRLSHLEAAIAAVAGLDHFVLTAPAADVTAAQGHISVPGTISYV